MDQFHPFQSDVDPLQIGPRLVARLAMIDAAHEVRAPDHLQAAVGLIRPADGDQAACQEW